MNVFTLQCYEIDDNWDWIVSLLSRVDRPLWTLEDVRSELLANRAQLWAVSCNGDPVGVVVTRLGSIGKTPTGVVWIASGESFEDGGFILETHIEPWFKERGCKLIEISGRRGWGKMLPQYQERATVFVKEL